MFILLTWLVGSSVLFFIEINRYGRNEFESDLRSIGYNNTNSIEVAFSKYINFLQITVDFFRDDDYTFEQFEDVITGLVQMEDFVAMAVVLPDDRAFISNQESFLPTEHYSFTTQMKQKKTFISDLYFDIFLQKYVVSVNVPLLDDEGKVLAYVLGILTTDVLSDYFEKIFQNTNGYFQIVDSSGRYIAFSDADNMFLMDRSLYEALWQVEYLPNYSAQKAISGIRSRGEFFTRYGLSGETRTAFVTPIDINGWMLLSVIPDEIISKEVDEILEISITLIVHVGFVFLMFLIWVYRSQRALTRLAEEDEKNIRFLAAQTKRYILEWDFNQNQVKISGNLKEVFGRDMNVISITQDYFQEYVHADDLEKAREAIAILRKGDLVSDMKLRVLLHGKDPVWCSFSIVPLSKKGNFYDRALGFMENIDNKERETKLLRTMSELDSLTHIYNKGTTERLIKKTIARSISKKDKHALIIIDLDNFKTLNDTFGHQYGDKVIIELAKHLKGLFRHNDVVGRVGGDEFFVFMKDISSEKLVVEKCANILENFSKCYEENNIFVEISVSIGIALYGLHGDDFETLYKNADIGLYSAKKRGKNNFQFYDGSTNINYVSQRTVIDSSQEEPIVIVEAEKE